MLALELDRLVTALFATLNTYETNTVIAAVVTTVAVWCFLFVYLLSSGSALPRWKYGAAGQRAVLVWSWVWTSGGFSVLGGWWGFLAWRLSSGLILVPTAPNEAAAVSFGYGVLALAAFLVIGWLPRLAIPARTRNPAVEQSARRPDDEPLYQPLYPDLSFEPTHQRTSYLRKLDPAPAQMRAQQASSEPVVAERPRRRFGVVVAIAALVVGVVVVLGVFIAPSTSAVDDRFNATKLVDELVRMFAGEDAEVIADRSRAFQTSAADIRAGDFVVDVERWRPLAEQGDPRAQYRLGVMFANGRGAERDFVQAYKWLNVAAAQGDEAAIEGRDAVARRMTPAQIETAQSLAREQLTVQRGNPFSGAIPERLKRMTPQELVRESQILLNAQGFKVGLADGVPGPRTRLAVREFERLGGLPETGEITHELVMRLQHTDGRDQPIVGKLGPTAVLAPSTMLAAMVAPAAAPAPRRAAPITECDRLAAHPSVGLPSGEVAGIAFARIDESRAIPACEQAVAQYPGELRFQFQLARSFHKAERLSEAVALYDKAGSQGFAPAQRSIGFMYANGSGVARDPVKAVSWLRQAAERCDVDAQFALGTIYGKGQGVAEDEAEALRWYRLAAAQDHPEARDRLNDLAATPANFAATAHRFEPGDDAVARHVDALLAKQDGDVAEAFARGDYVAVVAALRPRAEQGAAPAQTLLGHMYRMGFGVARDDSAAVDWYKKAADQDDADAQYLLGFMYQRGFGVPQYFAQALQLYRKAAEQGVTAARVNLGVMYDYAQGVAHDREQALAQYASAAEAGVAGAQYSLATAYENGLGVPRDIEAALKWYRLAAAQDFALAQNRLGELYGAGKVVPRDDAEAVQWYRRAAELGLPAAQFNLGDSLAAGRGVARDAAEAVKLFTAAAERGHAQAQVRVAMAHRRGSGVVRNFDTAAAWFEQAARQCNADAQFQLADMHRLGQGVSAASPAQELKWLKLAADQGHVDALQALGARYAEGAGVEKDPAKALKSIERAAAQGRASAQFSLAEMYAAGSDGVEKDYAQAAVWYEKAAQQGDRRAQVSLARLYREGLGVARSFVTAVMWYRQAAEQGDASAQHSLATAYLVGAGVDRDPIEAVRWFERAAEQGDVGAQRELGLRYMRGEGVLQDFVQARLWLGRAADRGDVPAAEAVDGLARKMTPNQISEAERLAVARPNEDG